MWGRGLGTNLAIATWSTNLDHRHSPFRMCVRGGGRSRHLLRLASTIAAKATSMFLPILSWGHLKIMILLTWQNNLITCSAISLALKFGQLASKRCSQTNEGMVSKSTRWNHYFHIPLADFCVMWWYPRALQSSQLTGHLESGEENSYHICEANQYGLRSHAVTSLRWWSDNMQAPRTSCFLVIIHCSMLMSEKVPGSPLFCTASNENLGGGLGT